MMMQLATLRKGFWSIVLVCDFCHENSNHVEDDEEIMPEEANLAKASKELGVAEVVGVVQDHWAHLVKKTINC